MQKYKSDGGAGLCIGSVIRKIVVEGKCLADVRAADTAGDVKLFVNYIVPERVACFEELVVIRETCDICHAGIEVYGTYCVSDCFILLPYRKVCLVVFIAQAVRILLYFFRVLLVKVVWRVPRSSMKYFASFRYLSFFVVS